GEGIGKVDGFPLFVKDALPGDVAEVKITKAKKNYAFARLEKIITPSADRVEPPCPYHRQCGGCQIQALSYGKQLEFKQNKVRNNLLRIGGFDAELIDRVMEPIIGMDEPWRYRNKAQYPMGYSKDGELITGFYAGRTHSIIANTDCLLGVKENQEILEIVLDYMKACQVTAYNEVTGKGLVRHVLIRKGFTSGQLMVCLVINGVWKASETLPKQKVLLDKLSTVDGMTSVSVNINRANTNVILGDETHVIWGQDKINDSIRLWDVEGVDFVPTDTVVSYDISARSFYQVNPVQTEKLYSTALAYAGLTGEEVVWDLYCGIGTISLFLAQRAKQVYGVEIVEQAILDARENAKQNGIENAEFFVGKAEEVLPREYEKHGIYADVIVVDPPRKGCDEICLDTILKMQPKKVVYVSCDSATLARDLKILCDGGYEIKKVRACDQFCHSTHVETVVLLSQFH
ncbi:MAG: 23S rRNA (uracil(1939)-C(5))-methyltransferase RlmD, partial [Lachnospiraceae bacterium]|nr:23S rRNA (uracil(1939)-C(5))-methyltransferase RlmD [Lachnospiraceae bacterium]